MWKTGQIDHELAATLQRRGDELRQQGQLGPALVSYAEALKCTDSAQARARFVQAVRTAHFHAPLPEVRAQVLRALQELWADPGELLTPATSLIEAEPAVREALARGRLDAGLWAGLWAALAADELLLCLLETDTVASIALERLLTLARAHMLEQALLDAPAGPMSPAVERLQAAIARQCFINEYVYTCSEHEAQQLARLQARLGKGLAEGVLPQPRWQVAHAAYAPLSELAGVEHWAAQAWPAPLADLYTQQVGEPAIERAYRAGMPCLTPVHDPVSQQVQAQYEAHPYPRWMRLPRIAAPVEIDSLLRLQFPGAPLQPRAARGPLDVLVAGCGTGQHPIQVAQQFKGARLLAVDLSLASLCYARRKTEEIGLPNIEYAQADILGLGGLNRRFDLIECAGVLHHLADPLAGWQVLLDLLRPGGLMLLGLYSELGRRAVVAARERVAAQGLPTQAADIRRCRQMLMADELAPQFGQFLASRDFYSTSACRDLLFHVQEHRTTLPQLKDILARLGLNFIGFMLDPDTAAAYTSRFPDDPARTNLDHWHAFETARSDTFSHMYQFWVQKPR